MGRRIKPNLEGITFGPHGHGSGAGAAGDAKGEGVRRQGDYAPRGASGDGMRYDGCVHSTEALARRSNHADCGLEWYSIARRTQGASCVSAGREAEKHASWMGWGWLTGRLGYPYNSATVSGFAVSGRPPALAESKSGFEVDVARSAPSTCGWLDRSRLATFGVFR